MIINWLILDLIPQLAEGDMTQHENATTANVRLVDAALRKHGPLHLFEFFVNPESFGQSVENLFYFSFLIREGRARIDQDKNGQPIARATDKDRDDDEQDSRNEQRFQQLVVGFTMEIWKVGLLLRHRITDFVRILLKLTILPDLLFLTARRPPRRIQANGMANAISNRPATVLENLA